MFIHSKKYLCVFKSSLVIFHMSPEMDSENIPGAHNSSGTVQGKQTLYVFKSTLLEFILVFLKFAASKQSLTHLFLQQNQNKPSEKFNCTTAVIFYFLVFQAWLDGSQCQMLIFVRITTSYLGKGRKLPVDISYFIYHNLSAKSKKGF